MHPAAEQKEEQTSCLGKALQPEKPNVSVSFCTRQKELCDDYRIVNNIMRTYILYKLWTLHVLWCYLTLWSLQEALSEFEVVNMEGKTSDALTVCTKLFFSFLNKLSQNNFQLTQDFNS